MEPADDLLDSFLPLYDVSDSVARVVAAPRAVAWEALMDADLMEVGRRKPLVGLLGAARVLPEAVLRLARGQGLPPRPESIRLREMTLPDADAGGWVMLGERPGVELAIGLTGKFWRPVIEYADVGPEEFAGFAEPGWAKTVYDLRAASLTSESTLLSATMRTATTDFRARRRFRRYWTFGVGSGAHVLAGGLLEYAAEQAENAGGRPAAAEEPAPQPAPVGGAR